MSIEHKFPSSVSGTNNNNNNNTDKSFSSYHAMDSARGGPSVS